ncbi:MAG: AEC family transporter [Leptolyngbya sp. DLM2.Bin15]|nr:MAG: AEC family transporter [Leptolyngbya sp. DLM2.Bin15]
MPDLIPALLTLYIPLIGWISLGWVLGRLLPKGASAKLGQFIFWIGLPVSIVAFLYRADLSGWILIAPVTAWVAIAVGAAFAWVWIDLGVGDERLRAMSKGLDDRAPDTGLVLQNSDWSRATQGSFLLAMMVGNTGYMGFPVVLGLVGPDYFAWALFYDLLGTFLGVYGVGVILAAKYGTVGRGQSVKLSEKILKNPAVWSLGFGLLLRLVNLPEIAETSLRSCAWVIVNLALVLIGMQLSQLTSLRKLKQALPCLGIKMVLVPLVVGTGLMFFGVTGQTQLALVLQMGMPPAFATVVFAEAYGLDRELAVTTLVFGCLALLILLPVWVLLFGVMT